MPESTRLVDLVQEGIDDFLDDRDPELAAIDSGLSPFIEYARDLLRGGKRFRALFCYWGWRATGAAEGAGDLLTGADDRSLDTVVRAATALEVFHAAALVHDDIIDNSDTRRGGDSVHRRFETDHERNGWSGSSETFGRSAAILLGDLLLAWSSDAFDEALESTPSATARRAARREFTRMRSEVMMGQYLDVLDEQSWQSHPESEQLGRAQRVIIYKSAKYSVEAPLVIGAALGGASDELLAGLRAFGLPLGIAFQLRDDLLGVFGDSSVTGKPSGDDLREGKRTVLVALARASLPAHAVRFVDEMLGDPDLTDVQVRILQDTLRESGAVDEVESIIRNQVERATRALQQVSLGPSVRAELEKLIDSVIRRTA
ncbi:geranylgeranyl diphosphate synthase type I [Cryobacterium mesophilum]|uniref:Polyprenyl synthetase family protein n=1 Tax=Terrimesophilobacter mesophilus TaxID=433647 RepID=A0A4R8V805_9MICO|nr:polyprenyl synthetase family protein [Terrimesophilobacter mesophilus]MBB5632055.1 geranylgeranyl diphosphate synthase type I [Terrimesophilobacter mesophilus]TFB78939.1 polyprenyl synthetase family protein [Terrimesophilobacter mesophilus]